MDNSCPNTLKMWRYKMEKNQEINCAVTSCRFNNSKDFKCTLQSINVEPIEDCDTCSHDESMCGSYEYQEE